MPQVPSSSRPHSPIKCNSPESINTQAWTAYGKRQLARACMPPVPDQMSWAP